MKRNQVIECEFCGKTIHYTPVVIKVEGALLNVCNACRQFGKEVEQPRSRTPVSAQRRKRTPPKQSVGTVRRRRSSSKQEVGSTLIDDYDKAIRSARMKKKLTQMQLAKLTGISHAAIQSIETGKLIPTDSDVKKLERELGITLMEEAGIEPEFIASSSSKKTTIGDIINIRRK